MNEVWLFFLFGLIAYEGFKEEREREFVTAFRLWIFFLFIFY
jgi:hypothetical protein